MTKAIKSLVLTGKTISLMPQVISNAIRLFKRVRAQTWLWTSLQCFALVGCATPPSEQSVLPVQRNHSGSPTLLLTGSDQWGHYFSAGLKMTYLQTREGIWQIDTATPEPMIDVMDDPADDVRCGIKGGSWNQRTTWFPDTAIFVRGGALTAMTRPDGAAIPLLPMVVVDRDYLAVPAGAPDSRQPEMAYAPCVGEFRVENGHRTIGYVSLGATLSMRDANGAVQRITLPTRPLPHLLLRYQEGALIPVPMRVVVATIDLTRRRMVLQFQATVPAQPAIRVIEWRALPETDQPSHGESLARYRERTIATSQDLAQCPAPKRPFEPCASPLRRPDRKIFSVD